MSIPSLSSTAHLISRTPTPEPTRRYGGSRGPMGTPGWALPFPSPKQPGEARPRPGKLSVTLLPARLAGAGSPPPAASERGRRRRGGAWYPAAGSDGAPAPSPPAAALTSARAGSRPCTAAGCGCSCWAGAGGSWFRWLRSSSGPARTPTGAQSSSGSSRSTSSRRVGAGQLPRAAIPPAQPARRCGRRKCGRRGSVEPGVPGRRVRQVPPPPPPLSSAGSLHHAGRSHRDRPAAGAP